MYYNIWSQCASIWMNLASQKLFVYSVAKMYVLYDKYVFSTHQMCTL